MRIHSTDNHTQRKKEREKTQTKSIHVLPEANKLLCSSSKAKYAYLFILPFHLICFSEIPFIKVIWRMNHCVSVFSRSIFDLKIAFCFCSVFNLKCYETYNLHKLCSLQFCFINISSNVTNNIRF